MRGDASGGLGVDVPGPEAAVAAAAEDAAVVKRVGIERVGERVDWADVVDGVAFVAADRAGVVVFEELFADALEAGVVAGLAVAWCVHGVFLSVVCFPPLRCAPRGACASVSVLGRWLIVRQQVRDRHNRPRIRHVLDDLASQQVVKF